MPGEFDDFTPDRFLPAVEHALGVPLTGLACVLPSYINRVYEIEAASGDRLVVKFYRPGRWTPDAILDEHDFLWDCDGAGIPVVPPYELADGSTLGSADSVPFAVFPKKRGREADPDADGVFARIGMLLGRIHACGAAADAPARLRLTPDSFAFAAMDRLFRSGAVHPAQEAPLMQVCNEILDLAEAVFPDVDTLIRIHGDFHAGNLLDRPGEGLMAIDFDDMAVGPAVQDLWLLLPGPLDECPVQMEQLLTGYRMFMDFRNSDLLLIEPLRAMRMMHFLSWCAVQRNDLRFRELYPEWGTEAFWRSELNDLNRQKVVIERSFDTLERRFR